MMAADTTSMSGREFEIYVRDQLMRQEGYASVEMTRESGDMGADLVVRHNSKLIVIQCKRYLSAVGLQAVQEVLRLPGTSLKVSDS
jgi:HJR/Mrr/RecB family endonuclease